MRALAISGSLRSRSTNTLLLRALAELAPSGIEIVLFQELDQIPPFNPDMEAVNSAGPVARFRSALRDSDVVIFSTPEYAHGLPGVLKNALDWAVGSGELSEKFVVLVNASSRGTFAQASLKEILKTMNATVLHDAEVTIDLLGQNQAPAEIARDPTFASRLATSFAIIADSCLSSETEHMTR